MGRHWIVLVGFILLIAATIVIELTQLQYGRKKDKASFSSGEFSQLKSRVKRALTETSSRQMDSAGSWSIYESSKSKMNPTCGVKSTRKGDTNPYIDYTRKKRKLGQHQSWEYKIHNTHRWDWVEWKPLLHGPFRAGKQFLFFNRADYYTTKALEFGESELRLNWKAEITGIQRRTRVFDSSYDSKGEKNGDNSVWMTRDEHSVTQILLEADANATIHVTAKRHRSTIAVITNSANQLIGLKHSRVGRSFSGSPIKLQLTASDWNQIKGARNHHRKRWGVTWKELATERNDKLDRLVRETVRYINCAHGEGEDEKCQINGKSRDKHQTTVRRPRILEASKFILQYKVAASLERERLVKDIMENKAELVGNEEEVRNVKAIIQNLKMNQYVQGVERMSQTKFTHSSLSYKEIRSALVGEKYKLSQSYVARRLAKLFSNKLNTPLLSSDPNQMQLNTAVDDVAYNEPVLSANLATMLNQLILESYGVIMKDLGPGMEMIKGGPNSRNITMLTQPLLGGQPSQGFIIYSFYKPVGRLTRADSEYRKNDALGDMAENTAKITSWTIQVTGSSASLAEEEAGPIFTIESSLVLHDPNFERPFYNEKPHLLKSYVHSLDRRNKEFYWSTLEILYNNYEELSLTDVATGVVTSNITIMRNFDTTLEDRMKLLSENQGLAGIVFPSRTAVQNMICRLEESMCALPSPEVEPPKPYEWNPQNCRPHLSISCQDEGCQLADSGTMTQCTTYQRHVSGRQYHRFLCTCGARDKQVVTVEPPQKNTLDFTEKSWAYLERVNPDPDRHILDIHKCKPTSYTSPNAWEYSCEDIQVLLRRWNITSEKIMLYDLADGDDEIRIPTNSKRINYYRITRGQKNFYGGEGSDIFDLAGPCDSLSGYLDGGGGKNQLIVSPPCNSWGRIDINLPIGQVIIGNRRIHLANIHIIQGRENQVEHIEISPNITRVDSGGGRSFSDPDLITILGNETDSRAYNTSIITSGYTRIVCDTRTKGKILIVTDDSKNNRLSVDVNIFEQGPKVSTYFKNFPPENLHFQADPPSKNSVRIQFQSQSYQRSSYEFNITFLDNKQTGSSKKMVSGLNFVFFGGPWDSPSYLILHSQPITATFYHVLTSRSNPSVTKMIGCKTTKNIFELQDGEWTAIGGEEDDEFILHGNVQNEWKLIGKGGNNTLTFHKSLKSESFDIDLITGEGLNGRLSMTDIQRVLIPEEFNVNIICGCKTKTVYALGGPPTESQRVIVPPSNCPERSLDIIASGSTKIGVSAEVHHPNRAYLSIAPLNQIKLNIEASVKIASGIGFTLQMNGLNWTQHMGLAGSVTPRSGLYRIKLESERGDVIDLKLTCPDTLVAQEYYLAQPPITVESMDGQLQRKSLVIETNTGIVKVQHVVDTIGSEYFGFLGLANIFRVVTGGKWKLYGGEKNDFFLIETTDLNGMDIDGGIMGTNTIVFDAVSTRSKERLAVDMVTGQTYFNTSEKGVIKNVQRIWGRSALSDEIIPGCDTIEINGQGGTPPSSERRDVHDNHDIIRFTDTHSCSWNHVRLQVPAYTIVYNPAPRGQFTYVVNDTENTMLHLTPTETNMHNITILERPWEVIKDLTFDNNTSTLKMTTLESQTIHEYKLVNTGNNTYQNPSFKFQSDGGGIVCKLNVTESSQIHATFKIETIPSDLVIQGLPVSVNNYIISITETSDLPKGHIQAPQALTKNNFIIHHLNTPLESVDGNKMCVGNENEIHFSDDFLPNHTLIVNMIDGFVRARISKSNYQTPIKKLKNIEVLLGRPKRYDRVFPNCRTTSVSLFEEINIGDDPNCESESGYDLVMGIDENTKVIFQLSPSEEDPIEGVFRYRFSKPRSFDIQGADNVDGDHIYYLPFTINRLDSLTFSRESKTLSYSVFASNSSKTLLNCSHKMRISPGENYPFYSQPKLITQERYLVQVSTTGSVFITMGIPPSTEVASARSEKISPEVASEFLSLSQRLRVSIIAKLNDKNILYVGHAGSGTENILQNAVNLTSHLINTNTSDTIYDIVALDHDVFVYPGFKVEDCNTIELESVKQIIDLTSVVGRIRSKTQTKYAPKIFTDGSDLVIRMTGHKESHPGNLRIVDGAISCFQNLQVKLQDSTMNIRRTGWENSAASGPRRKRATNVDFSEWTLVPNPIIVPQGSLYSIAPEDLEIGQEIRFQEDGGDSANSKDKTSFMIIKNGTNLIFTDMMSAQSRGNVQSTTTIVIPQFYETSNHLGRSSSTNNDTVEVSDQLPESMKVLGITINLPNVKVFLNDTRIENIVTPGAHGGALMGVQDTIPQVEAWDEFLHVVERSILRRVPEIQSKYQTNRKRIWWRLGGRQKKE